ncbi:ABC-type polysaccharide/polyol phosphate transport system, ATPase component [Pseudomonas sp. GM50]|uniref:ABC transporter ATP-binding protein n=1 Tax=Pseudomonas sp. GM50 TaxID=1144332 RepID=UPI000270AFED|nr:ABC transporter ATP-binding protein [Pseudomonas sp. GM50]EJM70724.1 ABC-type polysaccharide/polyol phosphate transport system, ATPase component [Pseudomonas sp. GM50]
MCSEIVIKLEGVDKCYQIYEKPRDRLLQMFAFGRKKYSQDFWALRDISFEVKRGETVGIVGRNGSGKSTLLQIICGTLNTSAGTVQTNARIAALLELGAGFNPEFSGRENVYLAASLYGLTPTQISERFDAITTFADIGDFIEQPVKSYSSGMFVRLAFAVIAHVDAEILIIDEALAVGDAFFTQKCMRFLREFMANGTVLFVSHDTAAVKALCTRAIWLRNGKHVATGPAKNICDAYLAEIIESNQGTVDVPSSEQLLKQVESDTGDVGDAADGETLWFMPFRTTETGFGAGGAKVVSATFRDTEGNVIHRAKHHTTVVFQIDVDALKEIKSPIIGFFVRDRLGQTLFGSNTFAACNEQSVSCAAGGKLHASFEFIFPALPDADYTVSIAIADGTQQDHTQLQWIHDALVIKAQGVSDVGGLIGLPMRAIELYKSGL